MKNTSPIMKEAYNYDYIYNITIHITDCGDNRCALPKRRWCGIYRPIRRFDSMHIPNYMDHEETT